MANLQQTYVYWLKKALGALDVAISSSANITTTGTVQAEQLTTTDDLTVTGLATVGETLAVTGVTTLTGGLAVSDGTVVRQWNHAGEGALTARGTDGVSVPGTIYYGGWIPEYNQTVTNINVLNGTTDGTDKVIAGIYSVDGTLLKSSALAGVTSSGADVYQQLPLTATQAVVAGTEYLVAIQVEGTTATHQRAAANFRVGTGRTGSQVGSFGTMATISSVASTFTADLAPLFFVD